MKRVKFLEYKKAEIRLIDVIPITPFCGSPLPGRYFSL